MTPTFKISSSKVAAMLADALGGTALQWDRWLSRDRRGRGAIAWTAGHVGRPAYDPADVTTFIEARRAIGTAQQAATEAPERSGTGRKLDASVHAQFDDETGQTFVQLVVNDPLRAYRLPLDQADEIARELAQATMVCRRATETTVGA